MNSAQPQFQAVKGHCAFVFDTLIAKLFQKAAPTWPENLPTAVSPLFVTYYKGKFSPIKIHYLARFLPLKWLKTAQK
jgi:hypothetical protein